MSLYKYIFRNRWNRPPGYAASWQCRRQPVDRPRQGQEKRPGLTLSFGASPIPKFFESEQTLASGWGFPLRQGTVPVSEPRFLSARLARPGPKPNHFEVRLFWQSLSLGRFLTHSALPPDLC